MTTPKLDRDQSHEIKAHQADKLDLWDSPIHSDRQNLTLRDRGGNDVLIVYGITNDQLADLYVEIGRVLGKSPDPTIHHLKQMHETIGTLIDAAASDQKRESELSDSAASE
ncbi:MAG: hypothetical protein HQ567_35475 [Candidatus Nealsonbacteria bacterium]|nr:hypothetical protein [Candidatus Nealsonbacteria bacterium]